MYNLKLSKKQLIVISQALESFARAKTGQFDYALEHVNFIGFVEARKMSENIKKLYLPELRENETYGIHQKKVSDDARIAYDIHQVIRNKIAWEERPEGGMTSYFDKPFKISEEELPNLTKK